jgi:hypothetical protein
MLNNNAEVVPRLWSREPRLPHDEVAPEHAEVHSLLDRWARANRERRSRATCASMERLFLRGGRDATLPSTAPSAPIALYARLEHVVLHLPSEHGKTIKLYYVERAAPVVICRRLEIRFQMFSVWMYGVRSLVLSGLGPCGRCRW